MFALTTPDLALTRYVLEREQATGAPFRLEDLQVLHELHHESHLTTADASALLQKIESQTRNALARMVEGGLVEGHGTGRARRYQLSAAVFRAISRPDAYVRVRPFDDLQQEQMVLSYVDAHGSIARSQAAQLCQISAPRATALLRRLVDRGDLVLVGERRGAHYVRPDRFSS